MGAETARLEPYGYIPVSQQYVQGQWSSGAFLAALVLCLVLIGFLIFVYMLIVKPEGTLTVTYERRASAGQGPAPTQTASVSASLEATDVSAADLAGPQAATKVCPQCAETIKAPALICRYCRYEFGQLPPAGQPGTPP
jgi:hypothetical protein